MTPPPDPADPRPELVEGPPEPADPPPELVEARPELVEGLPVDPDLDQLRLDPVHLRPRAFALVAAGGTVGTGLRAGLTLLGSRAVAAPYVTTTINLVGAFALGLLLTALARRGPDTGRRRAVRLLLGTGLLGGFTTYSSLSVDVARLGGDGRVGAALAVALITLLGGAACTGLGLLAGARIGRTEAVPG